MIARAEIGGGQIRLRFERVNDRYRHSIELHRDNTFVPVWESCEGTAEELWPASPPLQELHFEDRGNVQVAMLVGRAGKSHWSLSVTLDPAADELLFDAACRSGEVPIWLGSTYRELSVPSPVRIETVDVAGKVHLQQRSDALAIAAPLEQHGGNRTVRWAYRVRLSGGD